MVLPVRVYTVAQYVSAEGQLDHFESQRLVEFDSHWGALCDSDLAASSHRMRDKFYSAPKRYRQIGLPEPGRP